MERLIFKIVIDAPVEIVYPTMLEDGPYREWTSVFNPTSYYEGTWEQGSKMLFLGTEDDGTKMGMLSRIKEHQPYKLVSIEHLGIIENGREITSGEKVDEFAGALENYLFTAKDGQTLLMIETDLNEKWRDYFLETWPKALEKLKEICEKKA